MKIMIVDGFGSGNSVKEFLFKPEEEGGGMIAVPDLHEYNMLVDAIEEASGAVREEYLERLANAIEELKKSDNHMTFTIDSLGTMMEEKESKEFKKEQAGEKIKHPWQKNKFWER